MACRIGPFDIERPERSVRRWSIAFGRLNSRNRPCVHGNSPLYCRCRTRRRSTKDVGRSCRGRKKPSCKQDFDNASNVRVRTALEIAQNRAQRLLPDRGHVLREAGVTEIVDEGEWVPAPGVPLEGEGGKGPYATGGIIFGCGMAAMETSRHEPLLGRWES